MSALTEEERDRLRDWWDEDTTAGVESSFLIIARIVAAREQAARDAALAPIEDVTSCPHGERHYYAADATCQRCEMPSWVEVMIRAAIRDARGGAR